MWKALQGAYHAKKAANKMARVKLNQERARMGLEPINSWQTDVRNWFRDTILNSFCPCCIYDRQRRNVLRRKYSRTAMGRICLDGTYENDVLKSVFGFIFGLILTLLLFLLLFSQLKYSGNNAIIVASTSGLLLSLGMAFFTDVRCIVFLMLPQMFSSRGRSLLMAYALILVMNGPMSNFTQNLQVLSDSATCGQEFAANKTSELEELAKSPVYGIVESVKGAMCGLIKFINDIKKAFIALRDSINEIFAAMKRATSWLNFSVDICNETMGGPFKRCMNAFKMANEDCKRIMGVMDFMCHIAHVFRFLCYIAKIVEFLCSITEAIKNSIVDSVKSKVTSAIYDINEMFYVNVTLTYRYNYTETQSQSYAEVKERILDQIKSQLSIIDKLGGVFGCLASLMLLWLVIKAIIYRHKYRTNDRFDNRYVTFNLRDIDERREEIGQPTLLPLSSKLSKKYTTTLSPRLVGPEKVKLITGIIFLGGMFLHTLFYLMCDYGLYWLLNLIKHHAEVKIHQDVPTRAKIHVQGTGALAAMYRHMIKQFDPFSRIDMDLDTTGCLPHPHAPDSDVYADIFIVYGICLFLVITESYGLRLRHVIAGCYYPEREKIRAVWLYNHLYVKKDTLTRFMKRQIRRKRMCDTTIEKISLRSRLVNQFTLCRKLFAFLGYKRKFCCSCARPGMPKDFDSFKHCDNANCTAIYCTECYTDLRNNCMLCMNPIDYADLSDSDELSEEYDSSDEENVLKRREEIAERRKLLKAAKTNNEPSNPCNDVTDPSSDIDDISHGTVEGSGSEDEDQDYTYAWDTRSMEHINGKRVVTKDIFDHDVGQPYELSDSDCDDNEGRSYYTSLKWAPDAQPLLRQ